VGCCELHLWLHLDKETLLCKNCGHVVKKERKENPDTHRCVYRLSCPVCGKEKLVDCGVKLRVEGNGFNKLVEMK